MDAKFEVGVKLLGEERHQIEPVVVSLGAMTPKPPPFDQRPA
jgi:hypothetical protein